MKQENILMKPGTFIKGSVSLVGLIAISALFKQRLLAQSQECPRSFRLQQEMMLRQQACNDSRKGTVAAVISCFRKKNIARLALLVILLIGNPVFAAPPGNPSNWVLTFSDEFNGTSLDTSNWATTYPYGRRTTPTNNELEWYVDNAQIVSDGTLKLVAKHESAQAGLPYTSGMISSHKSFSQMYGYFEARMKLPAGKGFWPAFWLLPQPDDVWPPEIDIMENYGDDPKSIEMTHHYTTNYPDVGGGYAGLHQGRYTGPDYSADFHLYGVEWSPSAVVWYVDGVERYRSTQHVPLAGHGMTGMYIIANLAVGGTWTGSPDSSTVFPNRLEIDYIRAYQRTSTKPPSPTPHKPPSPQNFRAAN